jgi:hypothetical protein
MYQLLLFISLVNYSPKILTWDDYKGPVDSVLLAKGYVAHTETAWTLHDVRSSESIAFATEFAFLPDQSWTTTDANCVLDHEKVHYAISLLWYRKMQKRMEQYQNTPVANYEKMLKTFSHCWKEERKLQALFDRESRNGRVREIEKIWERNLAKDAMKLE